jgi:hypothetical protein
MKICLAFLDHISTERPPAFAQYIAVEFALALATITEFFEGF